MSMTDMDRSQPPHAPVAPDDSKNYQAGFIWGTVVNALKAGWNHSALFKKSLRVGSGTGLSAFDGQDGTIIASGALGQIVLGDIATPSNSNYAALFRSGTNLFFSTQAGTMWTINLTTGTFTQAWTGATFTNSWANVGGGNQGAGFRLNPMGQVEFCGLIKNGAAGTSAFTLPSNMWPAASRNFSAAYWTGAAWTTCTVVVTTAGLVVPESAGTGGAFVGLEFVMPL